MRSLPIALRIKPLVLSRSLPEKSKKKVCALKKNRELGKKQNNDLIYLIVFMIAISILGIVISKTAPAVLVKACGQDSRESRYFCFGNREA